MRSIRSFAVSTLLALSLASAGCAADTDVDEDASSAQASTRTDALKALLKSLRSADIPSTGGFGRSLAGHLDGVVRGAGEDVTAQRAAMKSLFGVDLPADVAPKQFVASMKRAFDLQYGPVRAGAANAGDAANNLAHVDSIVADIIGSFDDIVRNLEAAGIPGVRAMDLLLAVSWHDVGKVLDPAFIAEVPAVATLLRSQAFQTALERVPEAARANFKNKFVLQVLCHEFGSIRALGDDRSLSETVAKRLVSFIEDHNDGSGNPAAWWQDQWKTLFGVEYATPKTAVGFVLAALDRARQGSIEMLPATAGSARKLDGGIIKIAQNVKNQGKPLGFAVDDAILQNNARSVAQLRTMGQTRDFAGLVVTKFAFFKNAMQRNQVTERILASFVRSADRTADYVDVVDHGAVVRITDLDEFFKRLDDNWDELYAEAVIAIRP